MDKAYKEGTSDCAVYNSCRRAAGRTAGRTFVAYHVVALDFDFTAELRQAKELGIVSYTVVNNYAKSRDILAYMVLLVVPVLSATASLVDLGTPGTTGRVKHAVSG